MNGRATNIGSFPYHDRLGPTTVVTPQAPTRVAERGERTQYGSLATVVVSVPAALLYTVVSLAIAAAVILSAILVVPWLLLMPAIVAGLAIKITGFVLGGLGLI
jgi:hypothetical protein